ncbi:hypothetical protein EP47_13695 [Legionella norrlandica]|uniref:Uncharacterized protein n=1 Tax=Legionella norrlandica TaxID=1498499 RepID=A0A0A2SSN0_9GAMM|nr:hypothetical protein [Legionella norrlandica]KGP62736.1 hypothetical protein EP47_13695 [Legionella norrlandica]
MNLTPFPGFYVLTSSSMRASQSGSHQSLLSQFIHSCYDARIAGIAIGLLLANYCESWVPLGLMA